MNWKYLMPIIVILMVGSLYLMMDNADDSDAATGTYTDGDWTFDVSGTDAIITSNTATNITALNIPSTVSANGNTYTVTTIGVGGVSTSYAIVQNSQLASGCTLTIPSSVTYLNKYAFNGCSRFTGSLTIPSSVTSIDIFAFNGCSGFTGSLTIPNGVTSIGGSAFEGCSGLNGTLTLPSGLTSIGNSAFGSCSGFTGNLVIPNSVTSIGNNAFYQCNRFNGTLTLPSGLTSIGGNAFSGCSGFTGNLVIPNSVTSISGNSFNNCSGFNGTLTLPSGLTSIGDYAFYNCSGFNGTLTLPSGLTSIGRSAFYICSGFTGNLVIPNSVTSIGNSAFNGCSNIDSLINLSSATFGSNSLNMQNVKEVLNLGGTELNPGSYGLPNTCTVKTELDADSYIAPASIKQSHTKEGAVYTILALLPLFIILGALIVCANTIVRKDD